MQVDILALLDAHGADYRQAGSGDHHVRPGWVGVHCPQCGSGGSFHAGISLRAGFASCWRCGRLDLAKVLESVLRVSWGDAKAIAKRIRSGARPGDPADLGQPRGRWQAPAGVGPLLPAHKAYLRQRGLRPDLLAQQWGVQGIGIAAKYAWRLFVPVRAADGQLASWTTRAISDDRPDRWVSAPPTDEARPIKSLLYGWEHVRHAAIVVEGPSDAWAVGPGAVAVFGIGWDVAQAKQLAQAPVRAICFDAEPQAQRRARELAQLLQPFAGRTLVVQLDAPDPGAASPREIRRLRRAVLGD